MKRAASTLITLSLASLLAAGPASAEDQPPRYPPSAVRTKLIAGGVAVTGLAYGAGVLAASVWPEAPGSAELKIPVVGPWIALAKNACASDDPDCGAILYVRGILTVIGGLAQLGGLGIVGEGLFLTTEATTARATTAATLTLRPAPMITATSAGFSVSGAF